MSSLTMAFIKCFCSMSTEICLPCSLIVGLNSVFQLGFESMARHHSYAFGPRLKVIEDPWTTGTPQQLSKLNLPMLTERFPSFAFHSSVRNLGVVLDSTLTLMSR